ncbi:division abnormally delayed protein [Tribolium madens]|uniref:division abnormally delayed protein n=1 Tax=Tribolium madens TaxID=41895 RepID=UPI001CF732EE|nr:division abnormally delayed protein [Tribolium madens]
MSPRDVSALLFLCWCVMVSVKNVETSAVRAKRTTASCENVKKFFQFRNITMSPEKNRGSVCGGECCSDADEDLLRKQGQKDFAGLLRHNSRSLQGLLSFTAATLQNHISELTRQSENKTMQLFSQVYKSMAGLCHDQIEKLYSDIRKSVLNTSQPDLPSIDLQESVSQFFRDFFPFVYRHILHLNGSKDFTPDYKACLRKTTETIAPFADIPERLGRSLAETLKATRMLLQAFEIGIEVLNSTDRLLVDETGKSNAECHEALLKMQYCPKCLGMAKAKPCSGYCLNVLRGCLTKYVVELDSPWNGYVEGIESLIRSMKTGESADAVIRSVDLKISEALMRAMQKGKDIDTKVQRSCGSASFLEEVRVESSTPLPATAKPRFSSVDANMQLSHFVNNLGKTRGFYATLANTLCKDESFAETKDQRCWNGERIAEYTKMVVDVTLNTQRYNPEVKPPSFHESDRRVADLVDKLRQVHHMAMKSIGTPGPEVDYMQRDGVEGSGSGNGPDFEDNDDDSYSRGSGSGHGPIEGGDDGTSPRGKNVEFPSTTPRTAGAPLVHSSLLISIFALIVPRLF